MTKKCLFTKSTENVNTSVIVDTELGPITVHICDSELGKTLTEVNRAAGELISQAKTLAETFGFDLREAISKGGMITIGNSSSSVGAVPNVSSPSSRTQPMRMQEIPKRSAEFEDDATESFEAVEMVPAPVVEQTVQESVSALAPGEKISKNVRVQSPHGRQFELPERLVDETGETSIVIDTESEAAFRRKMEQDKKAHEAGKLTAYQDGYTTRFIPCKMCVDRRTKMPTGRINGQPCPKCKGATEIVVR